MFQPVIKWSGSKRSQASTIKAHMPSSFNNYYEPFVGGGSMLYEVFPVQGYAGDICEPLIDLWNLIKSSPVDLCDSYRTSWLRLQNEGPQVFYDVRKHYNHFRDAASLFFLSRTCVNGLIRFNHQGDFNNSFHLTRPGINPDRLERIVMDWSNRIQRVSFIAADYRETTATATKGDFVYLDPPYVNTKGRYYGTIDYDEFCCFLDDLNRREVFYALSYDGVRGKTDYTVGLPNDLYENHILIPSGNSSFRKVQGGISEMVYESLYTNYALES